jgi:hypothetical protein
MVGQNCVDSIDKPTCGDSQWCVQEMNVNEGDGVCTSFCDPTKLGSCADGYSCVAIGVALVASSPVIHVCQVTGSDSGIPTVTFDSSAPSGSTDASLSDSSRDHLFFDGGPLP